MTIDPAAFEARLKDCHNAEHTHPFDVLALVLEGDEDTGPSGVRYLVGRRPR